MMTSPDATSAQNLTDTWVGYASLAVFIVAYLLVILEELIEMRKSKPVIIAAGIIWLFIGIALAGAGDTVRAGAELRGHLLDYAEILLFLLTAMTYINTMSERNVFDALRSRLISSGYSLRRIYWITGVLAFFISAVADNLTTALIMAAVVIAVGAGNRAFVTVSCISIVVAANAGGAFSPFGDITTLMVWQRGVLRFDEFFALFVPALVNWAVPAFLMSFVVPRDVPKPLVETVRIKKGGIGVVTLFALTIIMTIALQHFLHLPPVLGMMTGLGLLGLYEYWLHRTKPGNLEEIEDGWLLAPFSMFKSMVMVEWDTLLFFYGVVLCVGGLGTIGYLALVSQGLYENLGPTTANILIGIVSAVVDNIPVMFAVLTMHPDMPDGEWLLLTLTAGVGGSLLSIGSAAGVAVMGQARDTYTFLAHLRWSWAIAAGYAASIICHVWLNHRLL
jgi:Na+/H+ antiporter NhaD/arsenite permease-like protein